MKVGNFLMLAVIAASLAILPIASANLHEEFDEADNEEIDPPENGVMADNSVEKTSLGGNMYEKTVETMHGEFSVREKGPETEKVLESSGKTYRSTESNGKVTEELVTPRYSYTKTRNGGQEEERCETPEGTYTISREKGSFNEFFDGIEREKAEEKCMDAYEKLEEERQNAIQISRDIGLVEDELEIIDLNYTAEYLEIENTGITIVELDGWKVEDDSSLSHTFEKGVLEPGETAVLKSGDLYDECEEFCWTSANRWAQSGDKAHLINTESETVDTYSYGG